MKIPLVSGMKNQTNTPMERQKHEKMMYVLERVISILFYLQGLGGEDVPIAVRADSG